MFEGAYHGRTNLTLSMTSKYGLFKKGFGPFAPEIYRLPFPNLYRRPLNMSEDDYIDDCIARLENAMIAQVAIRARRRYCGRNGAGRGWIYPCADALLTAHP